MKRLLTIFTIILITSLGLFCLTACNGSNNDTDTTNPNILSIYNMYVVSAQEKGVSPLSYEDWLLTIKGEKGDVGEKGEKGDIGVGIADIYVDASGNVMVKYTNSNDYVKVGTVLQNNDNNSQLKFVLNEDGNSVSVDGIGMYFERDVVIPSTYKGYPVTGINLNAFAFCEIDSVTVPESVTSIGSYAFRDCSSLTSVNYLGTIDGWAQIRFDNEYANPFCYADNFYINGTLVNEAVLKTTTKISKYAFENCSSLTSVTIGNSVTSIGDYAFENCSSLTSVTIGNSVTSIGAGAFYDCDSLTSVVIPDSVTSIGDYAFENCKSLTSVVIPDSVTSIGSSAFENCKSLTSVVIGDSVTSISSSAFYDCDSLTSVVIPDSVTSIGSYAFENCSSLTSVTIGNSVTSIGYSAFFNCVSLTSVVIPDSVTSIVSYAFYSCDSLTSIKYRGTSSQWSAISKGVSWITGNYTITYNYTGD